MLLNTLKDLAVNSMAAPAGNQNAKKGRLFEQALVREIKQRDLVEGDGETLRKLAASMLDKGLAGDLGAAREVIDRLDGKPAQTIQNPEGGDPFDALKEAARVMAEAWRNE
jgi:hypothetical protein